MQVQHQHVIAAPPASIFRIYADVANWHTWDPQTKHASLHGPVAAGTWGYMTPAKGASRRMLLTEVDPDRRLVVEFRTVLLSMRFDYELTPTGSSTRVVHRATFSGVLSPLTGRMMCARLTVAQPVALRRLERLVEKRSAQPAFDTGHSGR